MIKSCALFKRVIFWESVSSWFDEITKLWFYSLSQSSTPFAQGVGELCCPCEEDVKVYIELGLTKSWCCLARRSAQVSEAFAISSPGNIELFFDRALSTKQPTERRHHSNMNRVNLPHSSMSRLWIAIFVWEPQAMFLECCSVRQLLTPAGRCKADKPESVPDQQ